MAASRTDPRSVWLLWLLVWLVPLLGVFSLDLPWWLAVFGSLTLVLLVLWYGGVRLLGPLYGYELVRLARRGRTSGLRCAYGLALFGTLAWFYASFFNIPVRDAFSAASRNLPPGELARFTHYFVLTILVVQSVAVVLLTPAYVCSIIAEERERKTLDLLFTTHLSDWEILVGRLLGRLTHLGTVVLAGLPILSLTTLWGTEPAVLVASFAATGLSLLSTGSVALFCSAVSPTVLSAELKGYGMILGGAVVSSACCLASPAGFLLSPAAFVVELDQRIRDQATATTVTAGLPPSRMGFPRTAPAAPRVVPQAAATALHLLGLYAIVHVTAALFFTLLAMSNLRGDPGRSELPLLPPAAHVPAPAPRTAVPIVVLQRPRQVVSDPPLLWKETFFGPFGPPRVDLLAELRILGRCVFGLLALAALLVLPLVLSVVFETYTYDRNLRPPDYRQFTEGFLRPLLHIGTTILMLVWTVGSCFRIAGSVTRERERKTLVDLLMLPVGRGEILWAKWLGGLLRMRWCGYVLVLGWVGGLVLGGLHPVAAILLPLACAVHLAFVTGAALWLSVFCRTSLRAHLVTGLVLMLFYAGAYVYLVRLRPYSATGTIYGAPSDDWKTIILGEMGLNPIGAWHFLAFSWYDLREALSTAAALFRLRLAWVLGCLALFASATGALWLTAALRFRRESEQ